MTRLCQDRRPALSPMYRMQFEAAQDCWVLLYPEGMVKLNASAAEILRRCDGQASIQELVAGIARDFAPVEVESHVWQFLEEAHERGWFR